MAKCTCGRSTSGDCLGWHNLTEEEYKNALTEEENRKDNEKQIQEKEQPPQE